MLHKGTRDLGDLPPRGIDNKEWNMKTPSMIKNQFYCQIQTSVIYPGGESITRENNCGVMFTPHTNTTLEKLVEDMGRPETLEGYCDNDGHTHHVAALKREIINKPPVLIFCFNMFLRKVTVKIPENFENYKLVALCLHRGTLQRGHYVAFTRHRGVWYGKDDEGVTLKTPSLNDSFYFCVFKRV